MSDSFIRYTVYWLIAALALSTIMCFIVAMKDPEEFKYGLGDKQTYAYQQFFFELPFYAFLVVIASVLFSWQEMLELFFCQCREDLVTTATPTGVNSNPRPLLRSRTSSNAS